MNVVCKLTTTREIKFIVGLYHYNITFGFIPWEEQPVAFHSFHSPHCQSPEPCYPHLLLLLVLVDEDCPHISEGDVKEKNCFLLINYYHMKWLLWWLCFVIVLKSWVNKQLNHKYFSKWKLCTSYEYPGSPCKLIFIWMDIFFLFHPWLHLQNRFLGINGMSFFPVTATYKC